MNRNISIAKREIWPSLHQNICQLFILFTICVLVISFSDVSVTIFVFKSTLICGILLLTDSILLVSILIVAGGMLLPLCISTIFAKYARPAESQAINARNSDESASMI